MNNAHNYDYVRSWCRMMDTSFLIQLICARETALVFHWEAGRDYATFKVMHGLLPARFNNLPLLSSQEDGRIAKHALIDLCANELDARIPARV